MHRPASAENARSAQHHRRDCKKFIARSGVRFRLAQTRGVDHRRNGSDKSGEHISRRELALDRQSGVARTFRRKSDCAQRSAKRGAVNQQPDDDRD